MLYFDTLPKIISSDENGHPLVLTNIISRASLIDKLKNNPMLFYEYTIQDGDTPESLADKYYDNPYRFWIILYANEILDPLWSWPLNYEQFNAYINAKYATDSANANTTPINYTQSTIHHYEKVVTTTDTDSGTVNISTSSVDFPTYSAIIVSIQSFTLPGGSSVTYQTNKNAVSIYDYESLLNENKRIIKLLNESFATDMENQLKSLMV